MNCRSCRCSTAWWLEDSPSVTPLKKPCNTTVCRAFWKFRSAQLRTDASHSTFRPAWRASVIRSSMQSMPKAACPDSRASHSSDGKWVCSQNTPCTLEGFTCTRPWSRREAMRSNVVAEAGPITPQSSELECSSCYGLRSWPSACSQHRGIRAAPECGGH